MTSKKNSNYTKTDYYILQKQIWKHLYTDITEVV